MYFIVYVYKYLYNIYLYIYNKYIYIISIHMLEPSILVGSRTNQAYNIYTYIDI